MATLLSIEKAFIRHLKQERLMKTLLKGLDLQVEEGDYFGHRWKWSWKISLDEHLGKKSGRG